MCIPFCLGGLDADNSRPATYMASLGVGFCGFLLLKPQINKSSDWVSLGRETDLAWSGSLVEGAMPENQKPPMARI